MQRRRPTIRGQRSAPIAAAATLLVAVALTPGCSGWRSSADGPTEDGPVVATVDGTEIRLAELDERIRLELFAREFDDDASGLYEARRSTLDEMIDEWLLGTAAQAAGVSTDEYLESALAALPPISEVDVQKLFDDNRERLPSEATIEDFDVQLRAHLEGQRIEQVVSQLRKDADVRLSVPRDRVAVTASGPALGPIDAPSVIVAFSDFQCPFCARAAPILKALHERHPDDLRIVYRHMPLSFHGQARLAAIGGVCADRQNRFWEYHDVVFADQSALERDDLMAHAAALGLDTGSFSACLDDPESGAVVDQDSADAEALGVTGTPTFYLNGLKLTGARPVEHFEAMLAEESARPVP